MGLFLLGWVQGIPLGELRGPVIAFHRSVTHNVFLVFALIIIGFLIQKFSSEHGKFIGVALEAFGIGIAIHIALDFFYFDGVSIFWPIVPQRIYLPLGLPRLEEMSDSLQRLLAALDIAFDGFYWILVAGLVNKGSSPIIPNSIGKTMPKFGKHLARGGWLVVSFFSLFGFIGFLTDVLPIEEFVILIYLPGMMVLLISCLLPFAVKNILGGLPPLPNTWLTKKSS